MFLQKDPIKNAEDFGEILFALFHSIEIIRICSGICHCALAECLILYLSLSFHLDNLSNTLLIERKHTKFTRVRLFIVNFDINLRSFI